MSIIVTLEVSDLKYPNNINHEKKINHANLGMTLEKDINSTNAFYVENSIAIIHKKPTPIQIVKVDFPARNKAKITEAYYREASTTDYNGVYKGYYIDFDCKETKSKTSFPFKSIHEHQYNHLKAVKKAGGIAFLIIFFVLYNEYYLVPIEMITDIWDNTDSRSITYKAVKDNAYLINFSYNPRLDYLKAVDKYIASIYPN